MYKRQTWARGTLAPVTASGTLALVVAHPDDDAFGWAGSVALHAADPDFRFVLIHATDGGAGDIREGFPATRRDPPGRMRRGVARSGVAPTAMSGSATRMARWA